MWEIGNFSSDYGCPNNPEQEEMQQWEDLEGEYRYRQQQLEEKEKQKKFEEEFKRLQEGVLMK